MRLAREAQRREKLQRELAENQDEDGTGSNDKQQKKKKKKKASEHGALSFDADE